MRGHLTLKRTIAGHLAHQQSRAKLLEGIPGDFYHSVFIDGPLARAVMAVSYGKADHGPRGERKRPAAGALGHAGCHGPFSGNRVVEYEPRKHALVIGGD